MPVSVDFELRSTYLYAQVDGENSAETVFAYMESVLAKCEELECFRVLIHECLSGPRLPPMVVFEIVSQGSMMALGKFDAIAFVDEKMGDMSDFAENVAINRGMPIAMFRDVESAEAWIVRQTDDSNSQRIFRGHLDGDEPPAT